MTPTGLEKVPNSLGETPATDLAVPLDAKTKELMAIWDKMSDDQRGQALNWLRGESLKRVRGS